MEPGTETVVEKVLGPGEEFTERPIVVEDDKGQKTEEKTIEQKTVEQKVTDTKLQYTPMWERLEKDGVKLPEGFKEGKWGEGITDEFDALRQAIIDNTDMGEEDNDAFMNAYRSTPPEKRMDMIRSFNQQMEFFSLEPKDGISAWYKAQKDDKGEAVYTDEDIEKYITSATKINLNKEWEGIKSQAQQNLNEYYGSFAPKPEDKTKIIEETNTKIIEMVNDTLKDFDKLEKFGEVPLPKEFKDDFVDEFTLLNQLNPKTGKPYLIDMLSDNQVLRDMLLAYKLHKEDYYSKHLSISKENFKGDLLERMNRTQRQRGGSGSGNQFAVAQTPESMV